MTPLSCDLRVECLELAKKLGDALKTKNGIASTAESCTGGLIGAFITEISGSSTWFDRGFITYTNKAKMECLGVESSVLEQHGAVSSETAAQMVKGALDNSDATIAVAVTGIAGPTGAVPGKPVGTVYFGFSKRGEMPQTVRMEFLGDREQVRLQTVRFALKNLLAIIDGRDINHGDNNN